MNLFTESSISTLMVTLPLGLIILVVGSSISRIVSEHRIDYQPIASLFEAERSSGFNAIYRILTAPVLIVLASVTLYLLGREDLITNIWLAALWYCIFQTLLLVVLARWSLVNKLKFISFHIISIALAYYLYESLLTKGIARLLPDEANLRTEMWILVGAFFYGIFKNVQENNKTFTRRKERYVIQRAKKFKQKYSDELAPCEPQLQNILLSIMIYEDFNRPKIARVLERVTNAKTQGIMQATGASNDKESIAKTIKTLNTAYKSLPELDPADRWKHEEALLNLFKLHNPMDLKYPYEVKTIYDELQASQAITAAKDRA